jgi:hypothetical protein
VQEVVAGIKDEWRTCMVLCRQRRFGNDVTTTDYFDAAASAGTSDAQKH